MSGTHAATWWQKLTGGYRSFQMFKMFFMKSAFANKPGAIFRKLHFLCKLQMGPTCQGVYHLQAFLA